MLNCRLELLEADNERRRAIARRYREGLGDVEELGWQEIPDPAEPVYHQLTVRTARRDELQEFLRDRGIGSAVHYPKAVPEQPGATAHADQLDHVPVSRAAAAEVLSLPMFPELADEEVDEVIGEVRRFFRGSDG